MLRVFWDNLREEGGYWLSLWREKNGKGKKS
jgi:hypothetical protein